MDKLIMDSKISALAPDCSQRQLPILDRRKNRPVPSRAERGQVLIEALVLLGLLTLFFTFILHVARQQKQNFKHHRFSQQTKEIGHAKTLA